MLKREDLRKYQRRATRFMKNNPESGLFLDMGLGKTTTVLTALSDLFDSGDVSRVLVVGPLRVVQGVWAQEGRKWEHLEHLTFNLIHGSERERLRSLASKADIHLINVENFRWLLYVLKHMARRKGYDWPYDTLIIDESSMFKSAGSKRFTTLRHMLGRFTRRHILTGTPTPNGLIDIWSQVFIVDQGKRLGTSVTRFKDRFFTRGGYEDRQIFEDKDAATKVANLISPCILTMRAEDWLDLPPLIKSEVWVDLPMRARTTYDKMEKEMFIELDQGVSEAAHKASAMSKCHQIANGAVYHTQEEDYEGDKTWEIVHDAKIDALKEILEGTGSNILVAYYFGHDLVRLRKAFPKAPCIKDAKNQRELTKLLADWNAGKHRLMFIHPQGAGHGLNLQDGGNHLVFFSLLFGHEPYSQVIERIGPARQVGKAKRVIVQHILVRNTVDEALLASQRKKHDNERGFIASLQEYRAVKELLS